MALWRNFPTCLTGGRPGASGLTCVCCFTQLYERFRPGQPPPKSLGPSRDYNVDMVPKFIMNSGELVRGWQRRCMHAQL